MARWIWGSDNRDALNLDHVTRLEVFDNGNSTYDVRAYYTTGSGEAVRTVDRNLTLVNAQATVEAIVGDSVVTSAPVETLIDVDP